MNTIKLENAELIELIPIPTNSNFTDVALPPTLAQTSTRREIRNAPKNATIPTDRVPNTVPIPSKIASVAPRDAPEETPNI